MLILWLADSWISQAGYILNLKPVATNSYGRALFKISLFISFLHTERRPRRRSTPSVSLLLSPCALGQILFGYTLFHYISAYIVSVPLLALTERIAYSLVPE